MSGSPERAVASEEIEFRIAGVLEREGAGAAGERARLARDLHDGLAQDLWFMNLQVKLLQDALKARRYRQAGELAAELRQALESGYSDVRALVNALQQRPEPADLAEGLARLAQQFRRRGGPPLDLQLDLAEESRIAPAVVDQLLRVIQEALSNVAKHAAASEARVHLSANGEEIRLVIGDDGRGFDPNVRGD